MLRNFSGSIAFTVVCLMTATALGYAGDGWSGAAQFLFLAAVLGVMETSLSLDNAVVNATVLKDMDPVWQRRFLTWGIAIAVFGMRIVFPLTIVCVAAWVTPWEALSLALTDRDRYETIVTGAHTGIAGYGGAFLLLVGLNFFISHEKEHHWLGPVEAAVQRVAGIPMAIYVIAFTVCALVSLAVPAGETGTFLIAAASGIATFFAVEKLGESMGTVDETGRVVRAGAAGFVYLEFLDASFSFDGVIGAFAITNDILIIALGLGIGAMFVRSMTVALVRGGHLAELRYLEHGAFWAIMLLATIMLASVRLHVPEVITGLGGAILIALAWRSSIAHRRRFPDAYEDGKEPVLPSGTHNPDPDPVSGQRHRDGHMI